MAEKKLTEAELLAEVARLQNALKEEQVARSEAEAMAMAMASAAPFMPTVEEQPTGRTVARLVCTNPTERKIEKLKWKEVEFPTYYYRIELPAGAGINLSTNGMEYYHGEVYEFDAQTLTEMKSRVARCWDHEKSIHGDNENAYRKPVHKVFSGKQAH